MLSIILFVAVAVLAVVVLTPPVRETVALVRRHPRLSPAVAVLVVWHPPALLTAARVGLAAAGMVAVVVAVIAAALVIRSGQTGGANHG